jgi:hypothetical protein
MGIQFRGMSVATEDMEAFLDETQRLTQSGEYEEALRSVQQPGSEHENQPLLGAS